MTLTRNQKAYISILALLYFLLAAVMQLLGYQGDQTSAILFMGLGLYMGILVLQEAGSALSSILTSVAEYKQAVTKLENLLEAVYVQIILKSFYTSMQFFHAFIVIFSLGSAIWVGLQFLMDVNILTMGDDIITLAGSLIGIWIYYYIFQIFANVIYSLVKEEVDETEPVSI